MLKGSTAKVNSVDVEFALFYLDIFFIIMYNNTHLIDKIIHNTWNVTIFTCRVSGVDNLETMTP